MGQKVTLSLRGTLQLSIDGSPTARPLEVGIPALEVDLENLMATGAMRLDGDKVNVELRDVVLSLRTDAEPFLTRAESAIVTGFEEMQ